MRGACVVLLCATAAAAPLESLCGAAPCATLALDLLGNPCSAPIVAKIAPQFRLAAVTVENFIPTFIDTTCGYTPCIEAAKELASSCLAFNVSASLTELCLAQGYNGLAAACDRLTPFEPDPEPAPWMVAAAACSEAAAEVSELCFALNASEAARCVAQSYNDVLAAGCEKVPEKITIFHLLAEYENPCLEASVQVVDACASADDTGNSSSFGVIASCIVDNYALLAANCEQLPDYPAPPPPSPPPPPTGLADAIYECFESVPAVVDAGKDCVQQLSTAGSGPVLNVCPNSCHYFSKALVNNGCTSGNTSLVAMYAPDVYEGLMQIDSEIDAAAAYCGCLPWETPPSGEELEACASGLTAGLSGSVGGGGGLALLVEELGAAVFTHCDFISPPQPSCPLPLPEDPQLPETPAAVESLRQCLALTRGVVESGIACYEQVTEPETVAARIATTLGYGESGTCPESCIQFVTAASIFASDELEGTGCNSTLTAAGVVLGPEGELLLESVASLSSGLMAVLEEGTCGACLAGVEKLVTEDIPACLLDFLSCDLLVDTSESFADCKLTQVYADSMSECQSEYVELSQKKSECLAAINAFNATTDVTYELLECPLGCVDYMEKYVAMSVGPLGCFPNWGTLGQVAQSFESVFALISDTLQCSSECIETTVLGVKAALTEYEGAEAVKKVAALLGSSACPLPEEVQMCATFLATTETSTCPLVEPLVAAITG